MDNMIKIKITHLNFSYNDHYVLKDITAEFQENSITAIVGPSGTGKSTLLMTLNRLWEGMPNARMEGLKSDLMDFSSISTIGSILHLN